VQISRPHEFVLIIKISIKRRDNLRVINKPEGDGKLVDCDCGAELEYLPTDMYVGAYGAMYVRCPECDAEVLLNDEEQFLLTPENVSWPQHFSMPDSDDLDVDDKTIQNWVSTCLKHLESDLYGYGSYVSMGSGNTRVWAEKFEDEYAIYVTKSYAATSVPRKVNESALS